MSKNFLSEHRPVEIRHKQATRELEVEFDDGSTFTLPAELLRVESPSAEVQGHGPSQKQLIAGRREVGMLAIEPVGNYAIRISFDDLHDTGIYTWSYLYEMGTNLEQVWRDYIDALEAAGLSRDPKA
ncbi:MAG: DUF971 domain-containing protein [Proteobacteria bacterium]|nr:DUF971 domain-containing protein [Pseudomonadota bacterium]